MSKWTKFLNVIWWAVCLFTVIVNVVAGNYEGASGYFLAGVFSVEIFWLLRHRPDALYKQIRALPAWKSVERELPDEALVTCREMYNEDPEFIVMIEGAINPTSLLWDGTLWYDYDGNAYVVTHWMPMPSAPKEGKVE